MREPGPPAPRALLTLSGSASEPTSPLLLPPHDPREWGCGPLSGGRANYRSDTVENRTHLELNGSLTLSGGFPTSNSTRRGIQTKFPTDSNLKAGQYRKGL
ncbi:unnamed protein product [Rangifer tarandus platyrhynchus]|uniref:Uncharacterized protein n=2 Tax=Rangifer tarandus platyrhynchus TaxID=3082113 RepID=A0AC59ZF50_RANTA|nr:unnamed protein product [Rangifer tarandus platyrhynchus]